MVALTGCGALSGNGDGQATPENAVSLENDAAGETALNQTLRVTVDGSTNGTELTAIGATYPRENFTVEPAQHDAIELGVDREGDGELERTFDETQVSGVNNNTYSFEVTLDTDYTLQEGDVVLLTYPAIDNPDTPGEYAVDVRLNDAQTETVSVTIE